MQINGARAAPVKQLCRVIDCPLVATTTIGPIDFAEQVGDSRTHREAFAVCEPHAEHHCQEPLSYVDQLSGTHRMAERTAWARRCTNCGELEDRRHASRELAGLKAYAGYGGHLEQHAPRCHQCGSLQFTPVEIAEP